MSGVRSITWSRHCISFMQDGHEVGHIDFPVGGNGPTDEELPHLVDAVEDWCQRAILPEDGDR